MQVITIIDHHNPMEGIWLKGNPSAPVISNPTKAEQGALDGYWNAIIKHADLIRERQMEIPGWLPEFKMVSIF